MNTLNFLFNNSSLNIYGSIEEPYFKVNDVCDLIEVDHKSRMVREVLEENPSCNLQPGLKTTGPNGKPIRYIDEDGLYEILFRSNSLIAK